MIPAGILVHLLSPSAMDTNKGPKSIKSKGFSLIMEDGQDKKKETLPAAALQLTDFNFNYIISLFLIIRNYTVYNACVIQCLNATCSVSFNNLL